MLSAIARSQAQCCRRLQVLAVESATHSHSYQLLQEQHALRNQGSQRFMSSSSSTANTTGNGSQRIVSRPSKDNNKRSGESYAPYGEYHFRKSIERGRRQYSVYNVLTAIGLGGVCLGVYFYSLYAVKQEDFSDVPMPPEPTQEEKAEFERTAKEEAAH